jgi:tetratricopeptide (TPR) repeat protein
MVMEQFGPNGRPLTRVEMLDRSVDVLEQQFATDPRFIAEALTQIAERYMQMGATDKEASVLHRAESIARQLGDPLLLLHVQCNAVNSDLEKNRIVEAQRRMQEARDLTAANPQAPAREKIACMDAAAGLADALGDRAAAVAHMEDAVALQARTDPTDRDYRALLANAQVVYLYAGRPKDAYASAEKSLEVLRKTDPRNIEALANTMHNQSLALSQMGEISAAIVRQREAIALSSGNDANRPVLAAAAQSFGRLYTRMNDGAQAESWSERALAAAREGGNIDAQIYDLATLAEAQERAGHREAATISLAELTSLVKPDSDPHQRVAVARAQAAIALGRGDLEAAQASAAEMLGILGYPDMEKVRAAQASDLLLLIASRIAMESGKYADSERLSTDAMQIAVTVARDPQHSVSVGEGRLLLARAQLAQGRTADARVSIRGAAGALSFSLSPQHPLTLEAASLEAKL